MKTRWGSLWLCVALCMTALGAGAETRALYPEELYHAERGVREAAQEESVRSVAIQPGGVYVLLEDRVTWWQPGDEAPETLFATEEDGFYPLVAGDDGPYALKPSEGRMARVTERGYALLPGEVDLPADLRETDSAFVWQGALYLLADETLHRTALDGSPRQAFEVPGLQRVSPYREGLLLAGVFQDDADGRRMDLYELDAGTGALGDCLKRDIGVIWHITSGYVYEPETDAVYYLDDDLLKRLDLRTGESETLAFLPRSERTDMLWSREGMLSDGTFVHARSEAIYLLETGPEARVGHTLTLARQEEDPAYFRFGEAHPETVVRLTFPGDSDISDRALGRDILAGRYQADIYGVLNQGSLPAMLDEGYAADLSSSAVLEAAAAEMYPAVQAALRDSQGVLRAWPTYYSADPLRVNTTLYEACFPGEALPETWAEFLGLYLRYAETPVPGVEFMDDGIDRFDLLYQMLQQFCLHYGAEADFRHPALREALALMERLPGDGETGSALRDEPTGHVGRAAIFETGTDSLENLEALEARGDIPGFMTEGAAYRLMPPPGFEPGQAPRVPGILFALLVNPESGELAAALAYLEVQAGHMDTWEQYTLSPALTVPLRPAGYAAEHQALQEHVAALRAEPPDPDENQRAEDEAELERLASWLAYEEEYAWEVSPRALAEYRAIAPYVTLENAFIEEGTTEGRRRYELMHRYLEGELAMDAFLEALNEREE